MNNRRALTAALVCAACACEVRAQERSPAFEVAIVKASGPDSAPMSLRGLPGGRLVTSNTPLPYLIQWAYDLDDGRLLNVPKGFDALRFDVVAQSADPQPIRGGLQLMMRALLAERFKLAVHHETRALVAYTLVTDSGGVKVVALRTNETAGPAPFRMTDAGTLIGEHVTAEMLARTLSSQLGRPVRNMTGFQGSFDFTLRWAPDAAATPETRDRPSLLTAVREQLGFRLETRRTPTDVVVIDHIERAPAQN